jgi:predicted transcriptional regulator YdeE
MNTSIANTAASEQLDSDSFRFETRCEFWLVGLTSIGQLETAAAWTTPLWDQFIHRQGELPASVDRSVFITPYQVCGADLTLYVGFASPWEVEDLPDGMTCIRIPEQTYAVGAVSGNHEQIGNTYAELRAWVPEQGRAVNPETLTLEIYQDQPEYPDHPYDYEIWLPVR